MQYSWLLAILVFLLYEIKEEYFFFLGHLVVHTIKKTLVYIVVLRLSTSGSLMTFVQVVMLCLKQNLLIMSSTGKHRI